MKKLVVAMTITTRTATAAFANVPFNRADNNGDGLVSAWELVRSSLNLRDFHKADLNGNGKWTPAERAMVRQPLINPNTRDED